MNHLRAALRDAGIVSPTPPRMSDYLLTTADDRWCTSCHTLKPLDAFHRHKGGKHGRHSTCKACRSAQYQEASAA